MKHTRLRFLGAGVVMAAALVLAASSFVQWRTPAWGILIWGHRTDVFLGAVGLALLGLSLIAGSASGPGRGRAVLTGMLLATSALLFCLSVVEWYLRDPSRMHLRVASQVRRIESRHVEPGVGLRNAIRAGHHRSVEPFCNIPMTRKDPNLIAEERQEVECYTDSRGFLNHAIPESADIILLGDSFAEVVQVPWDQRWVSIVERNTGLIVYNLGHGGFCPSQEIALYARYGDIRGTRLVILGVYGINDLADERNFTHFLESGLGPREWALHKAWYHLPPPTFGFIQAAKRWRLDRFPPSPKQDDLEPISVGNTEPPTVVSYYPSYQLRAWQCSDAKPGQSPGVQSIEAAISRLYDLCRAQGRQAAVLYFPIKQTIHPPDPDDQEPWIQFLRRTLPWIEPEGWDRDRIVKAGRLLLQGDRRLEAHLSAFCDSLGVPFHSTIPALEHEARTAQSLTYYRFDTHWNTRGNVAVGNDVAAWVQALGNQ